MEAPSLSAGVRHRTASDPGAGGSDGRRAAPATVGPAARGPVGPAADHGRDGPAKIRETASCSCASDLWISATRTRRHLSDSDTAS